MLNWPAEFLRGRMLQLPAHQDDLETPGISPFSASPRKHSRQRPNFRMKARGRPHSLQRLRPRVENLGFRLDLAIRAVVAIGSLSPIVS